MRAFALLLAATVTLHAQTPASLSAPDPQVNPDRTVTFRFVAPAGAAKVDVAIDSVLPAPLPLTKSDSGQWTVTTPPLPPELYSYHFDVDGRNQLDPRNVTIKASYTASGNGFLVPGSPAKAWETTAIPHGTVDKHTYTTKVVLGLDNDQSEYYVYTPPGYDPRGKTKYPVLYLLHGWSDTAAGWDNIGHANDILDTLIAQGKAKPMIVVMPLGYGDMSFVKSGFGVWRDKAAIEHNTTLFSQALLTEVVPMVEKEYLTSNKREDRAIAGLSMGGLESLTIGLTHADEFAYVGGFSAAVHAVPSDFFTGVDPKKADFKLIWIGCGTEDDLITPNRTLEATLKGEGFQVTTFEEAGRHTWHVWRDSLLLFAPLLFQK